MKEAPCETSLSWSKDSLWMWFQGAEVLHRFAPESRVQWGWEHYAGHSVSLTTVKAARGPLRCRRGGDTQQDSNRARMLRFPGPKGLDPGPSSSSVLILGSYAALNAVTAFPDGRNEKRQCQGGKGSMCLRNSKQEKRTTSWSKDSISGYFSEEDENTNSKRYTHPHVHGSINHHRQAIKTT